MSRSNLTRAGVSFFVCTPLFLERVRRTLHHACGPNCCCQGVHHAVPLYRAHLRTQADLVRHLPPELLAPEHRSHSSLSSAVFEL